MKEKLFKHSSCLLIILGLFWPKLIWCYSAGIPFHSLGKFKLLPAHPQMESEVLLEKMIPVKSPTPIWALPRQKWILFEGTPQVDHCGIVHFPLRILDLNSVWKEEGSLTGDVYCIPDPFPRCGGPKPLLPKRMGRFLIEKLALDAQCRLEIFLGSQALESYEIQTEPTSAD